MDDGKKRQLTCCSLSSFQSLAALRQSIVVIQSRHHQASFSVIVKCLQWIHFQIKRMKKRELTNNERNSLGNTRDRTERDWTFRTVCWHIRLTKITVQRKRKFIYMKRTNEMVRLSCKRRYAYFVAINTKHDWNNTHEHGARAVDTNEKYSSALKWAQAKKFADCRGNWNWLLNENEMKKKRAHSACIAVARNERANEWNEWRKKKSVKEKKTLARIIHTLTHSGRLQKSNFAIYSDAAYTFLPPRPPQKRPHNRCRYEECATDFVHLCNRPPARIQRSAHILSTHTTYAPLFFC